MNKRIIIFTHYNLEIANLNTNLDNQLILLITM